MKHTDHTRLLWLLAIVFLILPHSPTLSQDTPRGLIAVWDAQTGEQTLTITPDTPVDFATFNTDQTRIVSRTEDGAVQVWDATTGAVLFTIPTDRELSALGLSAGTTQILFPSGNRLQVWDLTTGQPVFTLAHDDSVLGGDWNAAETRILTWGNDGIIRVWDAITGEELIVYAPLDESMRAPVTQAQWNAAETRILASGADGSVRVWDASTGEELLTLWHLVFWIGAQWTRDETRIMTRSHEDMLWLWDAETGEELLRIDPLAAEAEGDSTGAQVSILPYTHARWSPDGDQFLAWGVAEDPGAIHLWDLADLDQPQTLFHRFPMMYTQVDDAQWSADGSRILARTVGAPGVGAVWVWAVANLDAPLLERRVCCGELFGAAWNADETRILAWGRVWDVCGCE